MEKKYELLANDTIEVDGATLRRIRALRDFGAVKAGDLGGYIESEQNLSHDGTCWVGDEAKVLGRAHVSRDAQVGGHAVMTDQSTATDKARLGENARMFGKGRILERAQAHGNVTIGGFSMVYGDAALSGDVTMWSETKVHGRALLSGHVHMTDKAQACGDCVLSGTKEHAMLLSGKVIVETGIHVGDVITKSILAPEPAGKLPFGAHQAQPQSGL